MTNDLYTHLLAALIYAVLGILIFCGAFIVIDRLTPGSLWKELIEEHNTALAVVMAGFSIGICIVIAAAIV
jgi:putative membrane protein